MAYFAQINAQNVVTQVIAISNTEIQNLSFPESESKGIEFCKKLFGQDTKWVQTSYNANFRYNYAGIGYIFDNNAEPNGAFIPPKPYPSWILDTKFYIWKAPKPYPTDGKEYDWDEKTTSWILTN